MTRKISLGIVVVLILISICISSTTSIFLVLRNYSNLLTDLPQKAEQYVRLSEIDELLRSEYYGTVDKDYIDDRLAEGYIDGLNDPYSFYVSESDFEVYNSYLQGKIYGSGINAYYDDISGYLKVSYVDMDSPAVACGISAGDYIISVNGNQVNKANSNQLSAVLADGYDAKAEISFVKDYSDISAPVEAEVNLGYERNSCFYEKKDGIGYIRISAFTQKTTQVFSEALNSFVADAVKSIIIDVRNCSDNNFDIAAELIDLIVPVGTDGSGLLYTAKNQNGDVIHSFSSDAASVNCAFAVLINSKTEGAAELFAVDLSDFGKAVLVGELTAGRGKMQKLYKLSDGGAVFLTVAKVYPYISDSFDEIGVEPDILSESDSAFESNLNFTDFTNDHQYQAAYSYLTGK